MHRNRARARRRWRSAPEPKVDGPNPLQMHSARLTGNENQAEVQVALQTADYGHVEIKTTLQNSTLGATIAVEHSNLREQIVSALPELRHSFAERQITLESLTVSDSLSPRRHRSPIPINNAPTSSKRLSPTQGSQERASSIRSGNHVRKVARAKRFNRGQGIPAQS